MIFITFLLLLVFPLIDRERTSKSFVRILYACVKSRTRGFYLGDCAAACRRRRQDSGARLSQSHGRGLSLSLSFSLCYEPMTVSHCNVLEIKRGRGGLTYSRTGDTPAAVLHVCVCRRHSPRIECGRRDPSTFVAAGRGGLAMHDVQGDTSGCSTSC